MLRFFFDCIRYWLGREDGQDLIEYGLLALLISVVAVAVLAQVGATLVDVYFSKIPAALGT
ncbi:MAG: hypothetical protein M5U01_27170 [Ardenticatenaceae bacterium]|nr:hypothetical protein [Ardenticatenaceae bacterium]